ncbi:MAG: hypothetical protein ACRDPF_22810, partial [Streptosporangiaceae bacterium]
MRQGKERAGQQGDVGPGGRPVIARAWRTGAATGGAGSFVNTGVFVNNGTLNIASPEPPTTRPVAHSVYREQVRQIYPFGKLDGRDAELAELEAFCTAADGGPYAWWQGPAWAGKSALMAWFVLHPPDGVRMVSFFITARLPGQSDRAAFLEAVLEQLAEVAGQPVPAALTEANRQAWFGQLLTDAAAACAAAGQRLVLLVDGLDEDRGVTTSPDSYSIAALLPTVPPPGVRVVVAGRPNPPVPADVPAAHPLRDQRIIRPLNPSPLADNVRDQAERELDYLLDNHGPGRVLLGLVTVARGGLSGADLAELTGESPRTVDRTLRSVLGRTFQGRLASWRAASPPVFVLAHEDLQQCAEASLSQGERAGLLAQLHEWADSYRRRGWPVQTPEYLLRGYHRLLLETRDLSRMKAAATDQARLDRMLDISGGDAAALAEIAAVGELIAAQRYPDLGGMLTLAITRQRLERRNRMMPAAVPVAWARVGNPARAEALARSISSTFSQTQALAGVAGVLAGRGEASWAQEIIAQAEAAARSVPDPQWQARALSHVAGAQAEAGDISRAEALAS